MTDQSNQTIFKPVTHVIFDMDGLLLDSEACYEKIDQALIESYGKSVPDDLNIQLLGYSDHDCAKKIVELCDLTISPDELLDEAKKYTHLLRDSKLLPGVDRLIRHLASHNIPIAIGTSSSYHSVQEKLYNHGELFGLFHHMVMGSTDPEVTQGKPAPDIFLTCAKRFEDKPKPENCLVFEDAPNGVIAAVRAGMQVVFVPNERIVGKHEEDNATLIIHSLLDFKPEQFGLPAF